MYGSPQVEALFNIRVIDTDAPPTGSIHPFLFLTVELLKRREFIVQLWRTGEAPFVLLVDCLLQREALYFVKCLSTNLASGWEKPFSDVLDFVRSRLLFASARSASMCLRGSRIKWRSGGVVLWLCAC